MPVASTKGSPTLDGLRHFLRCGTRLSQFRPWEQESSWRVARLARIAKAALDTILDRRTEISVIQNDVGRFATQLLGHSFTVGAAADATAIPASRGSGKETMSTSGCEAIAAPTVTPSPFTMLKTPGGDSRFIQNLCK